MATSFVEFKLDFQVHLLKNDLPNYREALSSYRNSVQGAPLKIDFRQQRPGIFIIKTCTDQDEKKLENTFLTYYYGKKQEKQVKVKFQKLPKYRCYTDPKWVTIDWIQESGLRFAEDKIFDDFLMNYGTIIEATHDDKNELGMTNGRKKVRMDFDKGLNIGRIQWIEADVEIENGVKKDVKGKVKVFYANQPTFCKECETEHAGKCPAKIKKEEILKDYENKRQEKNKALLVSDSGLRHENEKAMHTKTHIASGAKIGHIVNVIENTDLENVENLIVNVGINNIDANETANYDKWYNQQKSQFTRLQNKLTDAASAGKKVRIVEVPQAAITRGNVNTNKMREAINKNFENMSKAINHIHPDSIQVIKVSEEMEDGVKAYEDEKHISEEQTAKLLHCIDASLTNYDLLVKNRPNCVPVTVKKIYSGVDSSYTLGCKNCTIVGHDEDTCEFKEKTSSKRKPSGSDKDTQNKKANVKGSVSA